MFLATACSAASFTPLGVLPGATFSFGYAISGDGATVGGTSTGRGFFWTEATGMVEMVTTLPSTRALTPFAFNADGTIATGEMTTTSGSILIASFRWQRNPVTGQQSVTRVFGPTGTPPTSSWTQHRTGAFRPDGATIVGWGAYTENPVFGTDARGLIEDATGKLVTLTALDAFEESRLNGISADGTIVIGEVRHEVSGAVRWEAIRLTLPDQIDFLGFLDEPTHPTWPVESGATDCSSDGQVVIGRTVSYQGGSAYFNQAFRWTPDGGLEALGDLPGGALDSIATACSADGTIVAGRGEDASGDEAIMWDASGTLYTVAELLTVAGIDVSGYDIRTINDISASGRQITGFYVGPSGEFRAYHADLSGTPLFPDVRAILPKLTVTPIGSGAEVTWIAAEQHCYQIQWSNNGVEWMEVGPKHCGKEGDRLAQMIAVAGSRGFARALVTIE